MPPPLIDICIYIYMSMYVCMYVYIHIYICFLFMCTHAYKYDMNYKVCEVVLPVPSSSSLAQCREPTTDSKNSMNGMPATHCSYRANKFQSGFALLTHCTRPKPRAVVQAPLPQCAIGSKAALRTSSPLPFDLVSRASKVGYGGL